MTRRRITEENAPDAFRLAGVVADLVQELGVHEDGTTSSSPARRFFGEFSSVEGDSLVAVIGERGSGKTTLLEAACDRLLDLPDVVVLPIVRPEVFRSTSSLVAVVVAHIIQLRDAIGSDTEDASALVQKALRLAALSAPGATQTITSNADSLAQYASDSVGLVQSRDQLRTVLVELVAFLRASLAVSAGAPIVVPVDDIDLVPQRTMDILLDLRVLSSVPGVVPLVCASRTDLRQHLEADLRRQYGDVPETIVGNLANQQLAKTIRASHTITPPYVRHEQRLGFRPVGEQVELGELVYRVFDFLDPAGQIKEGLAEWMSSIGDGVLPWGPGSPVAWMPDTPRGLEDLWLVGHELVSALADADMPRTEAWLRQFFEMLTSESDFSMSLDVRSVHLTDGGVKVGGLTRWSSTELELTPRGQGSWRVVSQSPVSRVRLRGFGGPQGTMPTREEDRRREMSPASVSSLLFLQEVFRLSAFSDSPPSAPGYIGGSDYSLLQSVRLLGQETDDVFFRFPIAKGGVSVLRSQTYWNALMDPSQLTLGSDESGKLESQVGAFTRRYVATVVDKWLARTPLESPTADTFESVFGRAVSAFEAIGGTSDPLADYTAESAFSHWFQAQLPLAFHELLLPDTDLKQVVSRWLSATLRVAPGGNALNELRHTLTQRASKSVSPVGKSVREGSWFLGYSALLAQIDSDLLSSVAHHLPEYQKLKSRGVLGRTVTAEVLPFESRPGARYSKNRPSIQGDAELQLALAVLAQLRS